MKKKIVLWGANEKDEKILVALELLAKENKVNIYTFDESVATESFYKTMMDEWRENKEIEFPENHQKLERSLSMTDELLPEEIKVQRGDIIQRAKAEWHFAVLSSKLYDLYSSELEEFKEKVSNLVDFDGGLFEELKSFWSKVADQARERNIFRDQADKLKNQTNDLFTRLKELRSKANAEFAKVSKERLASLNNRIDELNAKIEKGLGLNPIFEELKKVQADFKNETLTRDDRNKVWKKIDNAFKVLKEKKYGKKENDNNAVSRLDRRFEGLLSAIEKMERSIQRDEKDIAFQNKRANETDGQLEMQIRQAKVQMINERIRSKKEKLDDMLSTKIELEKRKEKEAARAAKREEQKEIQKRKEAVKEKIAQEINQNSKEIKEDAEKLEKAASEINKEGKTKPKKKETLLGAIAAVASETIEDVVDTVKAVTEVVGDKIGDKVEEVKEKFDLDEKIEEVKEVTKEVKEEISEKVEDVKAAVSEMTESNEDGEPKSLMDKISDVGSKIVDDVKEVVSDIKEEVKEEISEIKGTSEEE